MIDQQILDNRNVLAPSFLQHFEKLWLTFNRLNRV